MVLRFYCQKVLVNNTKTRQKNKWIPGYKNKKNVGVLLKSNIGDVWAKNTTSITSQSCF